jgi:outer membrane protein assembly factor BamB
MGLLAASVVAGLTASAASAHKVASAAAAGPASTWAWPGADLHNTRDVKSPITSKNVSLLGLAWSLPIQAKGFFGAYATTPVVVKGIMYTQDLASNVFAINPTSGKLLWEHKYNSPNTGPDGVTVANGTVYGTTSSKVFALQAATGEQLWTKKLTRNGNEGIDMAPGYHNGTLYVSTVPGNAKSFYAGNGQAILWAMNAKNGKTKWKWDEVQNLWGNKTVNSGGGQWDPPSFDAQGNLYVGVANPAPFMGTNKYPFGSSRPGSNLYTDSVVKLNAKTGKLMWYYQLTPHDVADWDMNNSPILTKGAGGKQIVVDGGKAGIVIALDASTGKLLWKRPVGVHIGPSNIGELVAKNPSKYHLPITLEPGDLGGVESQLASNGKTVFAAINDTPIKYTGQNAITGGATINYFTGKGEMVAINQANGKVLWDHHFAHAAYGAVSVTNDVAFTTTFDGTLWALNTSNGKVLWHKQLSAWTNTPVTINGNTVITGGTFPHGKGQTAQIQAFALTPGA